MHTRLPAPPTKCWQGEHQLSHLSQPSAVKCSGAPGAMKNFKWSHFSQIRGGGGGNIWILCVSWAEQSMEYAVHCFHPTLHSESGHITDWRAEDNYLTLSFLLIMISSYGEASKYFLCYSRLELAVAIQFAVYCPTYLAHKPNVRYSKVKC